MRSAADANVFNHLVVVAPMHDRFDVAAMVPVVAPVYAIPVIAITVVLDALVVIILVVIIPIVVTADNNSAVGIIVG
ncbi:hypothetical protein X742_13935 [Mesorhizobium sp. LNHC232B00]|nr:hypothetical protein X742_13935 [Mesorhizobium sp. LNHC232B00]